MGGAVAPPRGPVKGDLSKQLRDESHAALGVYLFQYLDFKLSIQVPHEAAFK